MAKILVTAFEPFGFVRRIQGRNSSRQVLRELANRKVQASCCFEVLPVEDQAEFVLKSTLDRVNPDGIVCMGEMLLQHASRVHIEPYAVQSPVRTIPFPSMHMVENSEFAQYAIEKTGQKSSSTIGTYYCNFIYLKALAWAGERQQRCPVVFIHVPVFGSREQHASQVVEIINLMNDWLLTG